MRRTSRREPRPGEDALLQAELSYISQTSFQANEDRARVSSFYLVAVGSIVAAVFSTQFVNSDLDPASVAWTFSGLFFILTLLGTLTTLQLARLRAAWHSSMQAMNRINEYWMERSENPDLQDAFLWKAHTLPARFKTNSVSYYQALEVALLSGLTFGACAYFVQLATGYGSPTVKWTLGVLLGLGASVVQLILYKRALE